MDDDREVISHDLRHILKGQVGFNPERSTFGSDSYDPGLIEGP